MKALAVFILVTVVSLSGCSNTSVYSECSHTTVHSECSKTTVHLHANDLAKADQENIRTGLKKRGFTVLMRENEFPSEGNLILYSSHSGIEEDLRAIEDVLRNHGLKAERSYAIRTNKIGVHEYTAGNIGLYIVPGAGQENTQTASRVRSVFPLAITDAELVSTDCPTKYVYQFESDKVTVVDLNLPIDNSDIAHIDWRDAADNMIIIADGSEQFTYRKVESHREYATQHNPHVVTYYLRLEPLDYYRLPFGCTYMSTYSETF